jgi:hypothetical protein
MWDDVQGGAGDGGGGDHLADRLDAGAGLEAPRTADVHEHRHAAGGGQAKDLDRFRARGARRVDEAHADPQRAGVDLVFEPARIACRCASRPPSRSALARRDDASAARRRRRRGRAPRDGWRTSRS